MQGGETKAGEGERTEARSPHRRHTSPMTDADLIYSALLRAEKRLEDERDVAQSVEVFRRAAIAQHALITLREEIGRGLAEAPFG